MSPDRVGSPFRIPEKCPHCGAITTVKLETTIKGESGLARGDFRRVQQLRIVFGDELVYWRLDRLTTHR